MKFDFTPDPKVLIALTHTPMNPLDALCELIDNAIDSFNAARIKGIVVDSPVVDVTIPSLSQIRDGVGRVMVLDNGPGMSAEEAEKAIKAGFSGNNPYDSLGLFGMGFNIASGKLGNRTTVATSLKGEGTFIQTVIDLNKINNTKNYSLDVDEIIKENGKLFAPGASGTIIEISDWWPAGNANNGFIDKLVRYGLPKIRKELGRRYSTILREKRIQILVNDEPCIPFEHCVWDSKRFVTKNGTQIPARFDFDTVLKTTRRCTKCTAMVDETMSECPQCGSTTTRSVQEKVRGWVGIQRFDDSVEYGIDLIRNGRIIRKGEKPAFFEFVDELQNVTKDYPIDSQYGRIVGEVHLDSVPVDFMKTDFQRASEEWQRAITYLRGETSLQPTKTNGKENNSPIYKLFQGYRRVRKIGKADMYMGTWDPAQRKAVRISRDVEKEYYDKFLKREPGYYDDAKWWELVETADQPPAPQFKECPECGSQNAESAEYCNVCDYVFNGKKCVNELCGERIPFSAITCPHCGETQVAKIVDPWTCETCGTRNQPSNQICSACGSSKDAPSPVSEEALRENSVKDDALTEAALTVLMANNQRCSPVSFEVFSVSSEMQNWQTKHSAPIVVYKETTGMKIFVDKGHPLFVTCNVPVEYAVAAEVAAFIHDGNMTLGLSPFHSITTLAWETLDETWIDQVKTDSSKIKSDISQLLGDIAHKLQESLQGRAADYVNLMGEEEKAALTANIAQHDLISKTSTLLESGGYLIYAPPSFLMEIMRQDPDVFFGESVWADVVYDDKTGLLDAETIAKMKQASRSQYKTCLECVVAANSQLSSNASYLKVVKDSADFLREGMV